MATIRMPEHQPHQHGDIGEDYNIATIVTVAVVGLIALLWSVLWLKAVFARADHWEWENKVARAHYTERETLLAEQEARLNAPGWTDPAKGRVSRPISDVQGQVMLQLQSAQDAAGRNRASSGQPGADHAHSLSPVQAVPVEPTAETDAVPAGDHTPTEDPVVDRAQEQGADGDAH